MTKPNFFIVGAPKCGTTALSEYLRGHPNIFMCEPKEPHFFAVDFPNYRAVKTEEGYLNLFSNASDQCLMIGEASVFYLYSEKAVQLISDFNSEAKILIMLRNPVDLIQSMHSQLVYTRDEDVDDFARAWSLIASRKIGESIPKNCRDSKLLFYDELGKQGLQLARVYKYFPKDQIKVIFSDDFFSDTKRVYKETLEFLGLKYDNRTDFQRINQNKRHKFSGVANFTQRPPGWLVNAVLGLKNILGLKRLRILKALRNINSVEIERAPICQSTKAAIINNYKDDILMLAKLTEKDLNYWLI